MEIVRLLLVDLGRLPLAPESPSRHREDPIQPLQTATLAAAGKNVAGNPDRTRSPNTPPPALFLLRRPPPPAAHRGGEIGGGGGRGGGAASGGEGEEGWPGAAGAGAYLGALGAEEEEPVVEARGADANAESGATVVVGVAPAPSGLISHHRSLPAADLSAVGSVLRVTLD